MNDVPANPASSASGATAAGGVPIPSDAEAAHALLRDGLAWAEAGQSREAEAAFAAVAASDHLAEWGHFNLGRVLRADGRDDEAEAAFAAAIALDPDFFWARYERLALAVDRGRSDVLVGDQIAELIDVPWESLQEPHVRQLERIAVKAISGGDANMGDRLLARLWPSPHLSTQSVTRLARFDAEPDVARDAAARLAQDAAPARTAPPSQPPAAASATFGDGEDGDTLARARARFDAGDHAGAAPLFEALAARGDYRQWGNFYLGRITAARGDHAGALTAYDAALGHAPTLFWAHYERLLLAMHIAAPVPQLADHASAIAAVEWEPVQGNHVRELERVAHAVWDGGHRAEAGRLLARLWPSTDLSRLAITRIVEGNLGDASTQAAERLASFAELDDTALRVLAQFHQNHGNIDREISTLERAFESKPRDFQTWLSLIRSYSKKGERARAFATLEQGKDFAPKQRLFVALIAHLELGELDQAFLAFRDHCRLYGEVPKFPGIRIAYLLGDLFDTRRRDEVLGLLLSAFENDRDIALVEINAAMRDQRWEDARVIFDRHFDANEEMPQSVRITHIDILAYSGRLQEAAALLERESAGGVMPLPFLRSTIRIFSELDRWNDVFDAGVRQLGDDTSFEHFLAPLIRAARKTGRARELFDGLMALPQPLRRHQLDALFAVMEDLAEQGDTEILSRAGDIEIPFEREHRIQLKLRGGAGPAPVEKDLCIYYCADKNYLLPALVSLTALAMSNVSITRRAVFHLVVDADVVPFAKEAGGAIARRLGLALEVTDASTIVSSADRLRTSYGLFTGGQQLALAAYYRIFFARWLVDQKRYSQALYVDADTVVRSGLDELFAMERGVPLLARYETDRPEVRHATEVHQLKGRYFNSGVLRFDLDHPGLAALLDKAIAAAIDPDVNLIFQDQCALNIAFDENMGELPDRFNYFNPPSVSGDGISASDAVIVHFLDRPKPWDSLYRRRAREWFEWFDLVETLRQGIDLGA